MVDLNLNPSKRILRQFGAAWMVALGALAARQWSVHGDPRAAGALLAVAVLGGSAGLARPHTMRWLFIVCTVAAFPVGWVVSQVMLLVLFAFVITPVAWVLKARGRDRLMRKPTGQASYWKPKAPVQDTRRYLRQY
jgi:hypothetical protein